jgi:hypothetical protein
MTTTDLHREEKRLIIDVDVVVLVVVVNVVLIIKCY